MRIGINCLQIDPSYVGGVNTYTLGVLEGFANEGTDCGFQLYVTRENQGLFESYRNRRNFDVIVANDRFFSEKRRISRVALLASSKKVYKRICDLAFDSTRKMMDAGSDIIYTPTVVLQCFNSCKPTVLSMHDIQHVHYPEFFGWTRRLNRKITYGLSAQYASFIQASSQFIKDDLLASFPGLSPRQIEVIPEGVNAVEFSAPVDGAQLDNYYLPDKFLFCPAQLWPHKNHITILRALKLIEAQHNLKIPLVLTGAKYSAAPDIFKFVAEQSMNYVFYLGKVPFKDLVALYQRAAFLITAVLYESSSLPVLEAAAAGTPIIASNIRPNQELAEVLQLNLFSPLDVEDAARLIFSLWIDEMNVSAQVRHNQQHILKYSWESVARKYLCFFRRIAAS